MTTESPKSYLIDMDGVLISGRTIIPGADRFIEQLKARGLEYLVLTNNSMHTPRDLAHRLQAVGLDIPAERIFTSAMATAYFLQSQKPNGTAFVIGESGLTDAIHSVGYIITDRDPDYVVLGETYSYNLALITKAIRLVADGARFIATNPDPSGPSESGLVPACGAMAALIETASGVSPFFVGKPNPWMMRSALNYLDVHSENTVMIGDRMDTDIVAGVESGMETILVLTGVTHREDVARYPYQPTHIVESVAEIEP
ncbi:MAG: TIGR01457 family HAD-type hydrolase [Anaerolineales bacterium]|nr:MAG: TIGR01457 family HAD-type hydrolase [Anaerolineales bacterium]